MGSNAALRHALRIERKYLEQLETTLVAPLALLSGIATQRISADQPSRAATPPPPSTTPFSRQLRATCALYALNPGDPSGEQR
jgi:hypothetical protein